MIKSSIYHCNLCSCELDLLMDLPLLPLTGLYGKTNSKLDFANYDQALMVCTNCHHAQLLNIIKTEKLYGKEYGFRTSESSTASAGSVFFANHLNGLFPERIFNRIVDFGCNDGFLLKQISHKGDVLLGVDVIWANREREFEDAKIIISGDKIEDIDFHNVIGGAPDLVVSQHTMEHIEKPLELLISLFSKSNSDTVFLFEVPCFDILLERFRFDQVFHQHLQYYSVKSFCCLIESIGGELIDITFNHSYWGAMLVAFKKKSISNAGNCLPAYSAIDPSSIRHRYKNFQSQMKNTSEILTNLPKESTFGYGAALMLPILGYHLGVDFSNFQAILDDDPSKDGLSYLNLPVKIQRPVDLDYSTLNICLTALDNRRPILRKLIDKHPKQIINPLVNI